MLYTIPKFTHYDLATQLISELAQHPNIIGLKDSSGDVQRLAEIIAATRAVAKRTVTVTQIFLAVTQRMLAPQPTVGSFIDSNILAAGSAVGTAVLAPTLKTRTREVGFQVLSGAADKILGSFEAGATGAALALAACAPQACHEVYVAWKENDAALAAEKQQRLVAASAYVAGALGVAGIKYACDLNGYYGGRPRLPLLPLSGEQQAEAVRVMSDLRN